MEAQQDYARRDVQEKKAAQQPVQREQQPPQEKQPPNQEVDKKALVEAAIQKNLEQNERVKEARVEEAKKRSQTPEKQALAEIAKDLAPKENPNRDQQQQQQKQWQR